MSLQDPNLAEGLRDKHVRVLSVLMHVLSAPLILMLLLAPVAALRAAVEGVREGEEIMVAVMMVFSFGLGIYGVAMLFVARGLWDARRWAGFWGVAISSSWLPLGLLPFAVYGLFALLRKRVVASWSPRRSPQLGAQLPVQQGL